MYKRQEHDTQLIRKAIRSGDVSQLKEICETVKRCGALEYTQKAAENAYNEAKKCLEILPDSPHKAALLGLAKLAVDRNK